MIYIPCPTPVFGDTSFSHYLFGCLDPVTKRVCPQRAEALPYYTKRRMAEYIIRRRGPLLAVWAAACNQEWLASMGYLYKTRSTNQPDHVFTHTAEHKIK